MNSIKLINQNFKYRRVTIRIQSFIVRNGNFEFVTKTQFLCHFFADYWDSAQGLSKNVSNVMDLYHKKKIERGGQFNPPPPPMQPVSKPDFRLIRVNYTIIIIFSNGFIYQSKYIFKIHCLFVQKCSSHKLADWQQRRIHGRGGGLTY